MYTVIRFCVEPKPDRFKDLLLRLGRELNQTQEGVFSGRLDYAEDRVSCDVSRASDWDEHLQATEDFLRRHREAIAWFREKGGEIQLDTAIRTNEFPEMTVCRSFFLGLPVMKKLHDAGVELVFSIYV